MRLPVLPSDYRWHQRCHEFVSGGFTQHQHSRESISHHQFIMPRNSSPAKPTQNSKIVKARRNNTSSISNLPRLTLTEAEIHQRPVALSEKHTTKTHALKIHHTPSVNEMKGFYRTKESQFQDAQAKQFIQLIVDGVGSLNLLQPPSITHN